MSSAKRWLINFGLYSVIGLILAASFNFLADPMWFFNHENQFSRVQLMINERQQKTNWLCYHPVCFDSVLMGSSRGAYINQNEFLSTKCFNYSVSSMKPEEYEDYLIFFSSLNQKPLERVFLGLDFFGTNECARFDFQKPAEIIKNAQSNWYFLRMLFNLDNMWSSWKNFQNRHFPKDDYYDRYNVKHAVKQNNRMQVFDAQVTFYREDVYGKYSYDPCYKERLNNLKQKFPNVKFHVFTTPVSDVLLNLLTECGRIDDYTRWLKEISEVFGSFDHFMIRGQLSHNSEQYFLDSHHLSQKGTKKIIQFIEKCEKTTDCGIGIRLTQDSIKDYIEGVVLNN